MLKVSLIGSLAKHLGQLSSLPLREEVQWQPAPTCDADAGQVDLFLCLGRELAAVADTFGLHESTYVIARLVATWDEVPAPQQVDLWLQDSLEKIYGFVVGYTPQMHTICKWVRAAAHKVSSALDLKTLIVGETGTGKQLAAEAIHRLGPRSDQPMVVLNCSGMPPLLADSELFGHVRGAYTGAANPRDGAARTAGAGVLFFDELSDMPLELQPKLLSLLETRAFKPLGSDRSEPFKAQVISATHQRLEAKIKQGLFRPDLYFRVAQFSIFLPALRERTADIELLVRHFRKIIAFPENVLDANGWDAMRAHSWPGNIRELRATLGRLAVLSATQPSIHVREILSMDEASEGGRSKMTGTLAHRRAEFDKEILTDMMKRFNGNTERVAQDLGISRRAVYQLLERHGIETGSARKHGTRFQ